ncbi:hypothetical protein Efla_000624 [Eimeria flavescens]
MTILLPGKTAAVLIGFKHGAEAALRARIGFTLQQATPFYFGILRLPSKASGCVLTRVPSTSISQSSDETNSRKRQQKATETPIPIDAPNAIFVQCVFTSVVAPRVEEMAEQTSRLQLYSIDVLDYGFCVASQRLLLSCSGRMHSFRVQFCILWGFLEAPESTRIPCIPQGFNLGASCDPSHVIRAVDLVEGLLWAGGRLQAEEEVSRRFDFLQPATPSSECRWHLLLADKASGESR